LAVGDLGYWGASRSLGLAVADLGFVRVGWKGGVRGAYLSYWRTGGGGLRLAIADLDSCQSYVQD
jgi:hypothetical protein